MWVPSRSYEHQCRRAATIRLAIETATKASMQTLATPSYPWTLTEAPLKCRQGDIPDHLHNVSWV